MYVWMYVRTYVRTYVCMYIYIHAHIRRYACPQIPSLSTLGKSAKNRPAPALPEGQGEGSSEVPCPESKKVAEDVLSTVQVQRMRMRVLIMIMMMMMMMKMKNTRMMMRYNRNDHDEKNCDKHI